MVDPKVKYTKSFLVCSEFCKPYKIFRGLEYPKSPTTKQPAITDAYLKRYPKSKVGEKYETDIKTREKYETFLFINCLENSEFIVV